MENVKTSYLNLNIIPTLAAPKTLNLSLEWIRKCKIKTEHRPFCWRKGLWRVCDSLRGQTAQTGPGGWASPGGLHLLHLDQWSPVSCRAQLGAPSWRPQGPSQILPIWSVLGHRHTEASWERRNTMVEETFCFSAFSDTQSTHTNMGGGSCS